MLIILSIVLFCVGICQCTTEVQNLLKYPITQTPYMVYFDKELRTKQFQETVLSKTVTLNGTGFWAKTDKEEDFPYSQSSVLPLFPKHPLFIKRKIDTEGGKIQIEIDWTKDYFATQRQGQQLILEMILYNYRGDKLTKFDITKPLETEGPQTHDTDIRPLSGNQAYRSGENADASDLAVAVFRVKTSGDSCPWTFLVVYPEQLVTVKKLSVANEWDLEKIIEQQSAFMSMSMLVTGTAWEEHAHKFAMFIWFSRAAGMSDKDFEEDKYMSAIAVPKSGSTGGSYNIKEIGQRSGAGFGLLYWNFAGHRFSEEFLNNFKSGLMIDEEMFQKLVVTCFAYGEILDARSQEDIKSDTGKANYRNKADNNNWKYNFGNHAISGDRKMSGEIVKEIDWTLDSEKNWKTTADGKIKV